MLPLLRDSAEGMKPREYKIAFIALRPFSENRGERLLGRLQASVHLTPSSIIVTVG